MTLLQSIELIHIFLCTHVRACVCVHVHTCMWMYRFMQFYHVLCHVTTTVKLQNCIIIHLGFSLFLLFCWEYLPFKGVYLHLMEHGYNNCFNFFDNSNICLILVLPSIVFSPSNWLYFLGFCMSSNFGLCHGDIEYYVVRLWVLLKSSAECSVFLFYLI